jgi:hypothetical protein
LELTECEQSLRVADAKQTARRIVAGDRYNQLLRRVRFPNEIALKIGQGCLTVVDLAEEFFEFTWVGVLKHARHLIGTCC